MRNKRSGCWLKTGALWRVAGSASHHSISGGRDPDEHLPFTSQSSLAYRVTEWDRWKPYCLRRPLLQHRTDFGQLERRIKLLESLKGEDRDVEDDCWRRLVA